MMKQVFILCSILTILFIPGMSSAVSVSISDASGLPGDRDIPVFIDIADRGTAKIYGIDLQLIYDAGLIYPIAVKSSALTSGWSLTSSTATSGRVNIALYSTAPLAAGEGSIAQIIFDVVETAKPGVTTQLRLSKATFEEHPAKVINNGTFTIETTSRKLAEQPPEETEPAEQVEETEEIFVSAEAKPLSAVEEVSSYVAPVTVPGAIVYRKPEQQTLEALSEEELNRMDEGFEPYEGDALLQSEEYPEEYKQTERPKIVITEVNEAEEGLRIRKGGELIKEVSKEEAIIPKIKVKELKHILIWRLYKLELDRKDIQPILWHLKDEKKLPYLLRLNEETGTIYGIVWGRKIIELNFLIITLDEEKIERSYRLEVK